MERAAFVKTGGHAVAGTERHASGEVFVASVVGDTRRFGKVALCRTPIVKLHPGEAAIGKKRCIVGRKM